MTSTPCGGNRPPRLTMDAYAEFVEASLAGADPVNVTRLKRIQKRITVPFSMTAEGPADQEGGVHLESHEACKGERGPVRRNP
jgi:hypothetical protein